MIEDSGVRRHLQLFRGKLRPGAEAQTIFIALQDRDRSKRWLACGTAFPVYVENKIVLVTAAHNFLGITDEPALLIGPNGHLRLFRDNFHMVGNTAIDLALIALSSDDLITLFGECVCVELDLDALPERQEPHAYQAYGYPRSKNKHSNTSGWSLSKFRVTLGPTTVVPQASNLNQLGVPLLAFELDLSRMVDDDGNPDSRIGKLDGMSGGPVISHPIEKGQAGPGKLAGVFLEWHSKEKIAVVMPALAIATAVRVYYS